MERRFPVSNPFENQDTPFPFRTKVSKTQTQAQLQANAYDKTEQNQFSQRYERPAVREGPYRNTVITTENRDTFNYMPREANDQIEQTQFYQRYERPAVREDPYGNTVITTENRDTFNYMPREANDQIEQNQFAQRYERPAVREGPYGNTVITTENRDTFNYIPREANKQKFIKQSPSTSIDGASSSSADSWRMDNERINIRSSFTEAPINHSLKEFEEFSVQAPKPVNTETTWQNTFPCVRSPAFQQNFKRDAYPKTPNSDMECSPDAFSAKKSSFHISENYRKQSPRDSLESSDSCNSDSEIMNKIMSIPDSEKQLIEVGRNILMINDELSDIAKRIRSIIHKNQEFDSDKTFQYLMRRQCKCEEDKKTLDTYKKELRNKLLLEQTEQTEKERIKHIPKDINEENTRKIPELFPTLPTGKNLTASMSKVQINKTTTSQKTTDSLNSAMWQCENCSAGNEYDDNVCFMCGQTTTNPTLLGETQPIKDVLTERCEYCTFGNTLGTKVCQMCYKTQSKYLSQTQNKDDEDSQFFVSKSIEDDKTFQPNTGFNASRDITNTNEKILYASKDEVKDYQKPDFAASRKEDSDKNSQDVMSIIMEADRAGFKLQQINIALMQCDNDRLKTLDWLKRKFPKMIKQVVDKVQKTGMMMEQNYIGKVSEKEAEQALLGSKGEINQAIELCVQERMKKYEEINEDGRFDREDVLEELYRNFGDIDASIEQLNMLVLQPFANRVWNTGDEDAVINTTTNILTDEGFLKLVKDKTQDRQRRVRMVLAEAHLKWNEAETVITILDYHSDEITECSLVDIVEAAKNAYGLQQALEYLQKECECCYSHVPMSKIFVLGTCECKICRPCAREHFDIAIREKFVRNWVCLLCEAPDVENENIAENYFGFLQLLLKELIPEETLNLFNEKLRDWNLQKNENFRWCAHCVSGFIWDHPNNLEMTCAECDQKTCFKCKVKWEDQHKGLTCEEFEQWKIDNDPEKQAKGVKLYLEENGIDCPSCKMRYALAKGGCMHFKCPQCGYEFCSGCNEAFVQKGTCDLLKSCKDKGFHCHHPRDCFYYMRDTDTALLQKLLDDNGVIYNTKVPDNQEDKAHCPVMEQKEYGPVRKDEECGKDTMQEGAGLCEIHFKEYLVGLINKRKIDPVDIMTVEELIVVITRNDAAVPERDVDDDLLYRQTLINFIQAEWAIKR